MCTAISYKTNHTYFGRNLDLERGYHEQVVITPRNFPLPMQCVPALRTHYAMIGMAAVVNNYPLYFEATNEKGLSTAGLNFPENAYYAEPAPDKDNIAPFEFIPWILGQCASTAEAIELLSRISLVRVNFSEALPLSPLHWMISDRHRSIVVESLREGLRIYENPFEVLTNNPPFDYHRINMSNYMGLCVGPAISQFGDHFPLSNYSLGMGALGLPGDYSSASRFVRGFFVKETSVKPEGEQASVLQFFHILNAVAMPKGCVWTPNGFEYTRYSSCCNTDEGIYYYTTYDNPSITEVRMQDADLEAAHLYTYPAESPA